MLWLCLYLPRLALDAAAAPEDRPFAVCGSDRRVLACNTAAAERGVRGGQTLGQAFSLCPALRSVARCAEAERETLESVASWIGQFGQPVTLDPLRHLVWVEIGRSLRLFGGIQRLLARCRAEQAALGLQLRRGVGPGLEAAALLARAGCARPVLDFARLLPLIAAWPQRLLDLSPEAQRLFASTGLRRIGQVLELPTDALARRLGQEVPDYLARLGGQRAEAWAPHTPPARYRRRLDLLCEIETIEGLRFPLRRLVHEFAGYLRARDVGVQRFALHFLHADARASMIEVALLAASRDAAQLLRLASAGLERQPPAGPIQEIRLEADSFLVPDVAQASLFGEDRALLELRDVLDRLGARLGPAAVCQLRCAAEHRPESSWQTLAADAAPATTSACPAPRPLWLLEAPQPIPAPRLVGTPERIEHGWWGKAARRDYHLAEDGQGRRLWVYREAGGRDWWLHGYWS